MRLKYLHEHSEFRELLRIVEAETGILAQLVEKDYWIMHVLFGLKQQGFEFELKGGTSLSKAFHIIDRFSEDIDIHIKPHPKHGVNSNPKNSNLKNITARKKYYDWLANEINIDGIVKVERDYNFDNPNSYASGGIRLYYKSLFESVSGLKDGVLLEVGFDQVTPNYPRLISSWAFDKAFSQLGTEVFDNRAYEIKCYHPGYTFVEKLQTISTKYRKEKETGIEKPNLLRQYYDVFSLLSNEQVLAFIGSREYQIHKEKRFPKIDLEIPISQNQAFLLNDPEVRRRFEKRYEITAALYYNGQTKFSSIMDRIQSHLDHL